MKPFIGVLCWEDDSATGKLVGVNWNSRTFNFPIKIKRIKELNYETVVKNPNGKTLDLLIKGAKEFEREGASAISTDCGFNVLWQEELTESVNIPVLTSGLLLVPLVQAMIGKNRKIAVITADSRYLTEHHLKAAGIEEKLVRNCIVIGLESEKDFFEAATVSGRGIKYLEEQDVKKLQATLSRVIKKIIKENPDIGAVVLECTDLPPFASAIQRSAKVPVFDIVTLMNMVYQAIYTEPRSHKIR